MVVNLTINRGSYLIDDELIVVKNTIMIRQGQLSYFL
jgi:hypothetical protein